MNAYGAWASLPQKRNNAGAAAHHRIMQQVQAGWKTKALQIRHFFVPTNSKITLNPG
jgi:hypothetical protein